MIRSYRERQKEYGINNRKSMAKKKNITISYILIYKLYTGMGYVCKFFFKIFSPKKLSAEREVSDLNLLLFSGIKGGTMLKAVLMSVYNTWERVPHVTICTDGTPKEVEVGSVVSLQNGTQDPGLCANPACDAACDAPAAVSACDARCKTSPTFDICMADCASGCHTFCGGQVAGRRYLDLAFAFTGIAANVCSDDASPAMSRLSAVVGIPKQILLRAPPSSPEMLVVRVERGGQRQECAPGSGYQLVNTDDGPAVQFAGPCLLQPDDIWDLRYLTEK